MNFLAVAGGVLLLGLLFVDIFITVFHASGRGGPLNRLQNRIIWRAFRAVGIRSDGAPRPEVLGLGGPTLVAVTLLLWLGWLVLGFFLIYLPFVASFLTLAGQIRTPWLEALTYSMYTASTLGLGDVVPESGWLRIITGVQAMSGFALFSISITYLLSIYSELTAARTTAHQIASYFADGPAATLRRLDDFGVESFVGWSETIKESLLRAVETQHQYPVLNYFYSADSARALPVQLGRMLDLDRLAQSQASTGSRLAEHPSYLALRRALHVVVSELDENFIPESFERDPEEAVGTERRSVGRLLRYTGYAGIEED